MAKRRPKYPHGALDIAAFRLLQRHPELTAAEMARRLGCSAKTLHNSRACPLTVGLREENRADTLVRRPRAAVRRRRPLSGDDES